MKKTIISESLKNIFIPNQKCIINTDLDGILSGMLLQEFLNWEVVGFSSCCGKPTDELWIEDTEAYLEDCVFVDLPVCVRDISVIDQHFVAFDEETIEEYNSNLNKINPNILRNRVFKNADNRCEYTAKYPFGTVHFILAVLENLGYIDDEFEFNFFKRVNDFDVADLVLRADRVIGNTCQYTPNCIDWSNWLMEIGGKNTNALFVVVKNNYLQRRITEANVEAFLREIGCSGSDGDCSNLFRAEDYDAINNYFVFLSECLELNRIPLYRFYNFNRLKGKRVEVNNQNLDIVKNEAMKNDVFSFAFVTMRTLSMTFIEED